MLKFWGEHPWHWLSGVDPSTTSVPWQDGRVYEKGVPLIWTTDEKDAREPIKPFPMDKPYLKCIVDELYTHKFLMVEKCRQMMMSWTALLVIDWECRFRPNRRWLLSKTTEEEGIIMLEEKVRAIQDRLPEWVQTALPQSTKPQHIVKYGSTKSTFRAVTTNAAARACRGGTASGVFVDEAPVQETFNEIVVASLPMTGRLWCVGTPMTGNPGAAAYKMYLSEGRV